MSARVWTLAAAVVSAAAGFAAAHVVAPAPATARRSVAAPITPAGTTFVDTGRIRDEVAAVVRDEMRRGCAGSAGLDAAEAPEAPDAQGEPRQGAPAVSAAPAKPTPEQRAAYDAAVELVQRACGGRWGDAQAAELRAHLVAMTDEQRAEVVQSLVQRINAQELAVETTGPFF